VPEQTHIVVLAAGRGSRMGTLGDDVPKWLLPVGDGVIADHHLRAFTAAAERLGRLAPRLGVVTGHAAGAIARWADRHEHAAILQVHNDEYLARNNWYSLLLALRALPADRVIVVNADLVADPRWMAEFLVHASSCRDEALIAVDVERPLTDESMKVAALGAVDGPRRLVAIGKTDVVAPEGEYIGMLMARGRALRALHDTLAGFELAPARANEWYERAVGMTAADGVPWTIWPTPDSRWVEIDDERDHALAHEVVGEAVR
jgi:choline kinase